MKMMKALIAVLIILLSGCFKQSQSESASEQSSTQSESLVESEADEPEIYRLSLFMTGDALLHGAVYKDAYNGETYDFSKQLEVLKGIVSQYDLVYYNQETILGGTELGLSGYPTFNSPQEFGQNMIDLGFNLVSLANNHTLDKGVKGIENSLAFWKAQNGVVTAGSYASKEERDEIPVHECNGISYTFLSYTYGCNGLLPPKGMEYLVNIYDDEMLETDIAAAREKSDVVIVAMHWGVEYTHVPTDEQKRLAQKLADLGVDIIIGNHPHVIQPIEWIGDTLVIYSCGNMISAQDELPRNIGMMAGVDIIKTVDDGEISIKIENVRSDLLFTSYNSSWTDFKLYTFDQMDDSVLANHEAVFAQYWDVVTALDDSIKQGMLMD